MTYFSDFEPNEYYDDPQLRDLILHEAEIHTLYDTQEDLPWDLLDDLDIA